MKKIFIVMCMLSAIRLSAHEGMWIPSLLDAIYDDMKAYGLQLSKEDLYSVNKSSLKDAIAQFGGGCTAEVVSDRGLLFTNHHCGYSYIQFHSSLEHDYLTDGFWAMNEQQELICDGLTATFIVSIDDVTDDVNKGITDGMSAAEKEKIRSANRKAIEAGLEKKKGYGGFVRAYNYGNQYFLLKTKTYSDVRLVGAPPSVIGKFGGDTDNWVWPRHTGDFSVFRIYANADNEPADYDASNQPYDPAHHLPICVDGVKEGEFSMVYGFPGRTDHFLTSWAVDYLMSSSLPMRIKMRENSLRIIDADMAASDKVRIQYAAKQSSISNAYKKWIGQLQGLQAIDAVSLKRKQEAEFVRNTNQSRAWANYQPLLPELEKLYADFNAVNLARDGFVEYMFYGPEIFDFAHSFSDLLNNYDKLKAEGKLEETIDGLKKNARLFYKDFNLATEKRIFGVMTPLYIDYVSAELGPLPLKAELMKKGGIESLMHRLYNKGFFADSTRVLSFLSNVNPRQFKKIKEDPAYYLSSRMYEIFDLFVRPKAMEFQVTLDNLMGAYVKGIAEMKMIENYWFDANSTLRLSFGKVEGSEPRDGMVYKYYTTADGILSKSTLGVPDFEINERMNKLLKERNYGAYAENGELHVCYTGSNHTTGGNSGSPALNAYGQLVGINFDRSWESTMSDVVYNPEICRNIMVDIRYVLWVIDIYADADYLLREMQLVSNDQKK